MPSRKAAYPVPDDCVPAVTLSFEQLTELRNQAADALANALAEWADQQATPDMYIHGTPPWRFHAHYRTLYEYKRPLASPSTASSLSHVFGSADGDYLDILRFFQADTRAEYYATQKKIYGFAVDAAVLWSAPRGSGSTSVCESVKLVVFDPLSLRFRMGSCHFEWLGTAMAANGRCFVFRVLVPVEFPQVTELFTSSRTTRLRSASVLIVSPHAHEPSSEVFMTMHNDFNGTRIPRRFYTRFLRHLHEIFSAPCARQQYVLVHSKWTRASHRSDCSLCSRVFSLLRSRKICARCRHAVCGRCVTKSAHVLPTKTNVCTQCVVSLSSSCEADSRRRGESHAYGLRLSEMPSSQASWGSQWDLQSSSSSVTWTNLSSRSTASADSRLSESLPVADFGAGRASNSFGLDPTIAEEDGLPSSARSVELSVDTSEMARSTAGANRIQSIQAALHEQEALLRQLLHASRGAQAS